MNTASSAGLGQRDFGTTARPATYRSRTTRVLLGGLIVASADGNRVVELLRGYTDRFYVDFHASAPPPERPTD